MKVPEKNQTWVHHQDTLPQPLDALTTRRILAYTDQLMCVENTCEVGSAAPMHSHPHSKMMYVVEGTFLCIQAGEEVLLTKGDVMFASPSTPHSCICQKAGVILDIFTPMREDFL